MNNTINNTIWIIIYSKYSRLCTRLFDMIETMNGEFPFTLLDIDNKEIRDRIKNDKTFEITYVPCIVSINSAGIASQYEGTKAFDVVKYLLTPISTVDEEPKIQERPIRRSAPVINDKYVQPKREPHREFPEQQQEIQKQVPVESNITAIENLDEAPQDMRDPRDPRGRRDPNIITENRAPDMRALRGKISVGDIMKSAPKEESFQQKPSPQTTNLTGVLDIVPKKTGAPINIADVMAQAGRS